MIDFTYPEEIKGTVEGISQFIEREVLPLREGFENPRQLYEPSGRLAQEILERKKSVRMKSAQAGYYTMFTPKELGGEGLGPLPCFIINYEIARRFGPRIFPGPFRLEVIANFVNGANAMRMGLNQQYKDKYLPGLLSGELASCFALTEPDAGSDVWMLKTRAVKDGDDYIINGRKTWISNAPYADLAMLFAVTDPEEASRRRGGITCFLVETKAPGFEIESVLPVWGEVGSEEGAIVLEDVTVPAEAVVGEVHHGFEVALLGVSLGRMMNGGQCTGLGEWALLRALEYGQTRVTFGRPLVEHQAIQFMLADSAMELSAAKSLGLRCGWKAEQLYQEGGYRALPAKEVAMTKAYCVEAGERAIDRAIQIHGGMGFANDMGLVDAYKMVRILRVPDGSAEMQRRTIAHRLTRGDVEL
jgi:acyl-CoA dehydrogenase